MYSSIQYFREGLEEEIGGIDKAKKLVGLLIGMMDQDPSRRLDISEVLATIQVLSLAHS